MDENKTNLPDDTELREQILTEFKQVYKLHPHDYTENCTNVVMSLLHHHSNQLIRELMSENGSYNADRAYIKEPFYVIPVSVLENKLKEG